MAGNEEALLAGKVNSLRQEGFSDERISQDLAKHLPQFVSPDWIAQQKEGGNKDADLANYLISRVAVPQQKEIKILQGIEKYPVARIFQNLDTEVSVTPSDKKNSAVSFLERETGFPYGSLKEALGRIGQEGMISPTSPNPLLSKLSAEERKSLLALPSNAPTDADYFLKTGQSIIPQGGTMAGLQMGGAGLQGTAMFTAGAEGAATFSPVGLGLVATFWGIGALANANNKFSGYAISLKDPKTGEPLPQKVYAQSPLEAAFIQNRIWGVPEDRKGEFPSLPPESLPLVDQILPERGTRLDPIAETPNMYRVFSAKSAGEVMASAVAGLTTAGLAGGDTLGGAVALQSGSPIAGIATDILFGAAIGSYAKSVTKGKLIPPRQPPGGGGPSGGGSGSGGGGGGGSLPSITESLAIAIVDAETALPRAVDVARTVKAQQMAAKAREITGGATKTETGAIPGLQEQFDYAIEGIRETKKIMDSAKDIVQQRTTLNKVLAKEASGIETPSPEKVNIVSEGPGGREVEFDPLRTGYKKGDRFIIPDTQREGIVSKVTKGGYVEEYNPVFGITETPESTGIPGKIKRGSVSRVGGENPEVTVRIDVPEEMRKIDQAIVDRKVIKPGTIEDTYLSQCVCDQIIGTSPIPEGPISPGGNSPKVAAAVSPEGARINDLLRGGSRPMDEGLYSMTLGSAQNNLSKVPNAKQAFNKLALSEVDIRARVAKDRVFFQENVMKQLPKEWRKDGGKNFFSLVDSMQGKSLSAAPKDLPPEVLKALTAHRQWSEGIRQALISEFRNQGMQVPDNFGIEGHIHHLFRGDLSIQLKDPSTGTIRSIGRAYTIQDAQRKIAEFSSTNQNLKLDAGRDFQLIPDIKYREAFGELSKRIQRQLLNKIADDSNLSGDVRNEFLRTNMAGEGKKGPGFSQKREGASGYEKEDYLKVMHSYSYAARRSIASMQIREEIADLALKAEQQGAPAYAARIRSLFEELNGKPTATSVAIDNTLSYLFGPRFRPRAGDRLAAKISGWNAISFLSTGKFLATQLAQPWTNTWPITSFKNMVKAYAEVLGSSQLRQQLTEIGIGEAGKFDLSVNPGLIKRALNLPIQATETFNQMVAYRAKFLEAGERGWSGAKAHEFAYLEGNLRTQFDRLLMDTPPAFKNPIAKATYGQFSRFKVKEAELYRALVTDLFRGEDSFGGGGSGGGSGSGGGPGTGGGSGSGGGPGTGGGSGSGGGPGTGGGGPGTNSSRIVAAGRVGKAILARAAFGGAGIYMTAKATKELYDYLEEKIGKGAAETVIYGLPAQMGVDMSTSYDFTYLPYGDTLVERIGRMLEGPAVSTIGDAILAMTTEDKGGTPTKFYERGALKLADKVPLLREIKNALILSKGQRTDGGEYITTNSKGYKEYIDDTADVWKKILGFRDLDQSKAQLIAEYYGRKRKLYEDQRNVAIQYLTDSILTGNPKSADLAVQEIVQWNELNNYEDTITMKGLVGPALRNAREMSRSKAERFIFNAPKRWRTLLFDEFSKEGIK